MPRRAISSNLDALADAWAWTEADRLAHALPLFHVHGLVLGTLGPLRRGGARRARRAVLDRRRSRPRSSAGATMVFGVPTMYHRLADAGEDDACVATALARARMLVSGSAALPAVEHERMEALTGQRVVERYGMTETLMNTAVRADGERAAGLRRAAAGRRRAAARSTTTAATLAAADGETIGEIAVRGPNLFTGYLNRPDATAEAMRDGWFLTGDLATRAADGYVRIVGRRSTDLIKSGGYKIGAGEIEGALLEHPAVAEVAVTGEPDADLGERVVAWVVLRPGRRRGREELDRARAALLSPHKRPREVRFLDELPRNAMGKVVKSELC